jgi:hypothetical protein
MERNDDVGGEADADVDAEARIRDGSEEGGGGVDIGSVDGVSIKVLEEQSPSSRDARKKMYED